MASDLPQQFPYGTDAAPEAGLATARSRWGDEHKDSEQAAIETAWYVRALKRRWLFAVAGAALGGLLFFGLASRERSMYEGVTTLVVQPASEGGNAPLNPATFRAIVENATLASQIIDELKLQQPPYSLSPQTFVEDALQVEEVRGTNIVKIRVTLAEPQAAAEASRRLADKAILLARQIAEREAGSVRERLEQYVTDARDRLQQAEQALLSFQQHAQVELIREDADAMLRERGDLLRLVLDIEGERARLAAAELEMKRQQPLLSVPRVPAAEEALRRSATAPTGAADSQRLDLANPFVNPVYQTLEFQIATSRTRIATLERQRNELLNVKKIGGQQLSQLSELYRREIEQERLQADLDLARRVYGDLALRYEQSRTLNSGAAAQLQIVDRGQPAERPLSRRRLQKAAFGSGAGFVGVVLLILLWESRFRRTHIRRI
jgi:uncharacterized protein involved in exopolysaccharide biosynthesis